MESHLPAIEELAQAAAEPNVFYEPWMLLPAIDYFGRDADLLFVLVYSGAASIPGSSGVAQTISLPLYPPTMKMKLPALISCLGSFRSSNPSDIAGYPSEY